MTTKLTETIRRELQRRVDRDGTRATAAAVGLEASQVSRFCRGERGLVTGPDLDRVVARLGLRLTKAPEKAG